MKSVRYRRMLSDLYGASVDVLFAHQDEQLAGSGDPVTLLVGHRQLRAGLVGVVESAEEILLVTGSRSRDRAYLAAVESVLAARPSLVHYRVLFGPPHRQILKDHLLRLLELRDPEDRTQEYKMRHLGLIEDQATHPERFGVRLGEGGGHTDPVADLGRGVRLRSPARPGSGDPAHRPRPAVLRRRQEDRDCVGGGGAADPASGGRGMIGT